MKCWETNTGLCVTGVDFEHVDDEVRCFTVSNLVAFASGLEEMWEFFFLGSRSSDEEAETRRARKNDDPGSNDVR